MMYTPTPDYYNDYLCHYGVKGMKWRNHIYRAKGKLAELRAKRFRKKIGSPSLITYGKNGLISFRNDEGRKGYNNSISGQAGSRLNAGLAAGRKRAKKKATTQKFVTRQIQKMFPQNKSGYPRWYSSEFRTRLSKNKKDPYNIGIEGKHLKNPRAGSTRGQGYSSSIGSADNNKATRYSVNRKRKKK